jgi:hypothetical protein
MRQCLIITQPWPPSIRNNYIWGYFTAILGEPKSKLFMILACRELFHSGSFTKSSYEPKVVILQQIGLAITEQSGTILYRFLSSVADPEPAMASRRQSERSFQREFAVLKHVPAS